MIVSCGNGSMRRKLFCYWVPCISVHDSEQVKEGLLSPQDTVPQSINEHSLLDVLDDALLFFTD